MLFSQFLEVEFEERNVLIFRLFVDLFGLLQSRVRRKLKLLNLDVFHVEIRTLFHHLDTCRLLTAFAKVSLIWGGKRLHIEHNSIHFIIKELGFLCLIHGFPFLDNFADNIGLSEKLILVFELIISLPGKVSVGGAQGTGVLSILS